MRLPRIDRILSADPDLQPVLGRARDIRELAGLVCGFLPRDLASETRVANFRDGELVLLAANPSVAAKLKLLGPSLSRFLSNRRWQVSAVSVRVQLKSSRQVLGASQKSAHFSTHTLDSLRALHEHMGDSPARDALAALLRHQEAKAVAEPRQENPGPGRERKTRS